MPTAAEVDFIQSGVQGMFVAACIFCATYIGLNRRWWKNPWAQVVVSLDLCLLLADLPACLRLWFNLRITNDFFAIYQGTSLWLTTLVILWRAGMIAYIQFRAKKGDEEEDG